MGQILKEGYYIFPHVYIPPSFMSRVLWAQYPNGILAQTGQISKRRDIILIYPPPHTHTHIHHHHHHHHHHHLQYAQVSMGQIFKGLYSLVQGICPKGLYSLIQGKTQRTILARTGHLPQRTILAHTRQIPKDYTRSYKANPKGLYSLIQGKCPKERRRMIFPSLSCAHAGSTGPTP